jgi:YjbE family integral membrane protein
LFDLFTAAEISAFFTVIGIDLVLSGDNAIVIGTAAAGLSADLRKRAIVIGIVVAALARMVFSMGAFYLLKVTGLLLIGGLLLFWVAWTMWRQIKADNASRDTSESEKAETHNQDNDADDKGRFRRALIAIVIADVSMSLDNVLAVAGAARDHLSILIFGLALSIALMGFAANYIARLMERYKWIAYVGVVLVAYVGADMSVRGAIEVYGIWAG